MILLHILFQCTIAVIDTVFYLSSYGFSYEYFRGAYIAISFRKV